MFVKVVSIKADFAEAYNNLGIIYSLQNDYNQAIINFRKAVELINKFDYAYYNLFLALKEQKRIDEAIIAIKNAIRFNKFNAEYYCELGNTYIEIGDKENAIIIYGKLIGINKDAANKLMDKIKMSSRS